jgi:hypothetical protein
MIKLDQIPCRIGTTRTIEGTEMSREDVMGMCMADHRSTRLLVTHLDKITETKAVLSLSIGKSEFPIDFPALQDAFYLSGCPTSSNLLIIPNMMSRLSQINGSASIPSPLSEPEATTTSRPCSFLWCLRKYPSSGLIS